MSEKLRFVIIIWLVLSSGAVVFQGNNHLMFSILLLLIVFYVAINPMPVIVNTKYLLAVLLVCLSVIITMVSNSDYSKYLSYLNFMAHIIVPFMIPMLFKFSDVVEIYSKIIIFLSITSLIIYGLVIVDPNFYRIFPKVNGFTELSYFNLYLYVVTDAGVQTRNNSLFWEAGAFQAFLTLGLLLEIYWYSLKRVKNILILVVASLTTFSTTGYLVLVALFLLGFSKTSHVKNAKLIKIVVAMIIIVFFSSSFFLGTIIDKFSEGNQSSVIRLASTLSDLLIFYESALHGVGFSGYEVMVSDISSRMFSINMQGSVNSLTYHCAVFGVLFVFPLLFCHYRFAKGLTNSWRHSSIVFLIMLVTFSTENFFSSIIWLTFAFYGLLFRLRHIPLNTGSFSTNNMRFFYCG